VFAPGKRAAAAVARDLALLAVLAGPACSAPPAPADARADAGIDAPAALDVGFDAPARPDIAGDLCPALRVDAAPAPGACAVPLTDCNPTASVLSPLPAAPPCARTPYDVIIVLG
jgi:hypothetical protein